jgi:hypothetical protein
MTMKILPHGRLQEWVAEEQGLAQMDIDLRPESFKHHHLRAVPEKYRHQVDVRTFGIGERTVFLPYTREVFAATQARTRRVFSALPEAALYDAAALA